MIVFGRWVSENGREKEERNVPQGKEGVMEVY